MQVSGRAVAITWVAWTLVLAAAFYWQWRQLVGEGVIGVVIEPNAPLAVVGGLLLVYSPPLVLTVIWLLVRARARRDRGALG